MAYIYAKTSPQDGVIRTFRESSTFKSDNFLNSKEHVPEICLYHDDFSIANLLGNKTHNIKYQPFILFWEIWHQNLSPDLKTLT